MPKLQLTPNALEDLKQLEDDPSKRSKLKAVNKALRLMQNNLRHPSLNTHEYSYLQGPRGEKVFEAYAEQNFRTVCVFPTCRAPRRRSGLRKGSVFHRSR
jgi:hypothetical protein